MKEIVYSGIFAGRTIRYSFRHPETADVFQGFLKADCNSGRTLKIPYEDSLFWFRSPRLVDDADTEYCMSIYRTSDELLKHNACIFHAAALLWREKAWLFVGDSGVGKTTQINNWKKLYGNEIKVMNGDKPILKCSCNGSVMVHPSPWKGKEGWGDDSLKAPLGGLIFLKQGDRNSLSRTQYQDVLVKTMTLIFSTFSERRNVRNLCYMTENLLSSSVPCWTLVNKGDLASSRLTHDYILVEEANGNDIKI